MVIKRKIENWNHYYAIACSRPELKEFRDILVVNANMPHVNMGENKIAINTKEKEIVDGKEMVIHRTEIKTVNELLKELAPTNDI